MGKRNNQKAACLVAKYLGTGEKNRMTSEALCDRIGCNRRSLQKMINRDRKNGAWIISFFDGLGGYALAESQEEYEAFCERLISKQLGSVAFFRKQIKNYDVEKQQSMDLQEV